MIIREPDAASVADLARGLTFSRPSVASFLTRPAEHPDPQLQAAVEAAAEVSYGELGAMVIDLDTGGVAAVHPDRVFPAASLFKLPILVEVLEQEAQHQLEPQQLLEIRPDDWTDGSGVLQTRVGDRLRVQELVRLMIQDSDNIAALVLLDAVSAGAVNARLAAMGLSATHVRDHRAGETEPHVTSPRDMARLLADLASAQLFDPDTSEAGLRMLELHQASNWLGDKLPWWAKVAHKWGDLPEARHDVGIVFTPRGSYISAVLTENGRPEEARQAIARIARAAYDARRRA